MNKSFALLLSITFALLFLTDSFSQTEKGNFYLGLDGAISFGKSNQKIKSNDNEEPRFKNFGFSISPEAGYFLIDNLVVGFNIQYSNFKSTTFSDLTIDETEFENKSNRIAFNNFWRYYFKAGKVLPFLEAFAGFGSFKTESTFSNGTFKSNLLQFGGGAGIAIPLGSKVSFDTILNWSAFLTKAREENASDITDVTRSLNLSTGFSIYLD
ncbi:hypothetical protein [Maribacter sp. R77961]|uniref:hypothetical protein n=1 Tax=Maribacter sp. R77961 TaxID=3093871 RepID=UPI0037C92352